MWQKIELYIISLWLLFLLVFINKIQIPFCFGQDCHFIGFSELLRNNVVPTICLFFMILGIIFYFRFDYRIIKGAPELPKKIVSIQNLNFETLSFLITYIIPIVTFDLDFDLDKNRNLLMFLLVLFLIGWIYIKTNMFYTNPSLAVLGFRIYKVDTEGTHDMTVIVKGKLKKGDNIYPIYLDDNIYFIKKT
jgi:hypothetical protein